MKKNRMKLFHLTTAANADAILNDGFRDSTHNGVTGIWFAVPAITHYFKEGEPINDTVVSVEMPDSVAHKYDITSLPEIPAYLKNVLSQDAQKITSREFCVPASVVNAYLSTVELSRDPNIKDEEK